VIKKWIDKHYVDFKDDPELVSKVLAFTDILARDMGMQTKASITRLFSQHSDGALERKGKENAKPMI
jgi:hypothetical protein